MSNKQLTTTNKNTKLVLNKSKNLLNITNKLLSKKDIGQLIQSFQFKPFLKEKGHSDNVNSVAISSNGKTIVSGGDDKTIKIWDIQSGECLKTLKGHLNSVNSVAISPNGKTIVSGSWDKTIKIWDEQSGECLKTLKGHLDNVNLVVLSPNGKTIVSGSSDKTIKIWDIQSGECLKTLRGPLTISSDGKTMVSESPDNTIKIWDIQSGECLKTFEGHLDSVNSVAISSDEKTIVSGSWDETIRIWDIQSGECIYTSDNTAKVSIDKDGYFVGDTIDIQEYVRVSEAPLTQRKLTDEEIKHFRKKGNFLKIGKIKNDIPFIDIDEDEIHFRN